MPCTYEIGELVTFRTEWERQGENAAVYLGIDHYDPATGQIMHAVMPVTPSDGTVYECDGIFSLSLPGDRIQRLHGHVPVLGARVLELVALHQAAVTV